MNSKSAFQIQWVAFLAILCASFAARAADTHAAKQSGAQAPTNNAVAEVSIPQSVFDYDGKGLKDPFFPLSTRVKVKASTSATNELAISGSIFKLKGMSGTADNPLALINNRTLAVGESAEVTTETGRYKIHCLEIRKYSVVIRVQGQFEPVEVFLPKADR